ncbi:MAG: hypothetical protein K9N35_04090 [Candidatus Marinimicrobia bacterium]|nr:hypothetical protein [Candidatus Neomarinimicrobiota bacterium]
MFRYAGKFALSLFILTGFVWAEQIVTTGEPMPLTNAGDIYLAPKWSPDGSQLAVSGSKYTGIYLINIPGGEMKMLTDHDGAGYGLSWSPKGDAIAAQISNYVNYSRQTQLMLFKLDGSEKALSEKKHSIAGIPSWSKTGEHVYLKSGTKFQAFATDVEKADPMTGSIVYLNNLGVYKRELESETEILISDPQQRVLHLAISPSGDQFVYSTVGEMLWLANIDGSQRKKLGRGTAPDWSPDGRWIVSMITSDDGHVFTSADLIIYNATSGVATRLTQTPEIHEMHPAWSPDGKWIAYENEHDGRIWLVEVEEN